MKPTIVIGLATYQRPNMVADALRSLKFLKEPKDASLSLIVCDNDVLESARPVFSREREELEFQTKYVIEERRGIVHARNRILQEAMQVHGKCLAFFDDDEKVDPEWVVNLYETLNAFGATVVSGKVEYVLPQNAPDWHTKRNFYGGEQPQTGSRRIGSSTNNTLIDLGFIRENQIWFNLEFNMSGGEDTLFFRELRARGGKIVSCAEAITYETVPESRLSEEWILMRSFKVGYNEYNRNVILIGELRAAILAVSYCGWLFMCHVSGRLLHTFSDYSYIVFNRRRWSKLRGLVHAMTGKSFEEYHVIHGE